MKIAQVAAYWGPAYPTGSGVFCYELSRRLAQEHEVHVFTSSVGNFNNLQSVPNLSVHRLRTYGVVWDMNPLANVLTPLLRGGFDIIHVHSYIFFMSNMAALARFFKRRSRYILHFHGGLTFTENTGSFHPGRMWAKEQVYDRTLGYLTARMADRLFTASANDIPTIRRKFGGREAQWVPNGVDTGRFEPGDKRPDPPVVTYVGKLEKWKGADTLIKSFEMIHSRLKDVRFLVVGSGSLEAGLRKVDLPIEFRGAVPYSEMPEVYRQTSVLLLPSYMEGFPCTCVEALASQVPVVATDVGDIKEIVLNGETGFLTRPGDAAEVAARTVEIIGDPALAKRLGERGRVYARERFSYEAVTAQVVQEYNNLVA